MSDEFGGNIITLTDEDGQDYEFEHIDTLEHNGETYMAFIPADIGDESEEVDFIILKVVDNDGEDDLITVEDDAELEEVYTIFMKRIEEYEEEEELV